MGDKDYWADSAPQFKKDGEMYGRVEYDPNGDPRWVQVTSDQSRLAEFEIEDGVAVYDPHRVTNPTEEIAEYVKQLPFVDEVEL